MAAASLVQLVGEGLARTTGLQVWEVVAGVALGALFYAGVARWVQSHETFDPLRLREAGGAGAVMIVAAMTAHSLPEGIAIGVAFGSCEAGFGVAVVGLTFQPRRFTSSTTLAVVNGSGNSPAFTAATISRLSPRPNFATVDLR